MLLCGFDLLSIKSFFIFIYSNTLSELKEIQVKKVNDIPKMKNKVMNPWFLLFVFCIWFDKILIFDKIDT
jgi:hypothetical protein